MLILFAAFCCFQMSESSNKRWVSFYRSGFGVVWVTSILFVNLLQHSQLIHPIVPFRVSGRGYKIGSVCVCVCVSVCQRSHG